MSAPSSPRISVHAGWSTRGRRETTIPPEKVPPTSDAPGEVDITPSVRGEDVGFVVESYLEARVT